MKVQHSIVNNNKLNTVPIINGQIVYVKDTHDLYFDVNNTRTKATDIIFVDTIQERDAIQSPTPNKVYCVIETNCFYRYENNNWQLIGGDVTKSYVDAQDIATLNSANSYTDDVIDNFTPLQSFPTGTITNGTTTQFFNSITATNPAVGSLFLGTVTLSDMPTGLSRAEVEIEVYNNGVLYGTMRSANLSPYVWYANSYQYRGWEAQSAPAAEHTSFDNTDTDLTSTNVEDAIVEINNKIGELNTLITEINGE